MEKLELKHIAPYLPYGVKCEILNYKSDYVGEQYGIITGYYWYAGEPHYMFKDRNVAGKDSTLFKPFLRPLSQLTQEIEHNGEKFTPIVELLKIKYKDKLVEDKNSRYNDIEYSNEGYARAWFKIRAQLNIMIPDFNIDQLPYFLFQKLIEWHFDVFGLIDKGLAVELK